NDVSSQAHSVEYYETVEKLFGPSATREFFRLFMIPGADHCGGGEGAWAIDYLTHLEKWVERNQAPEVMVGAHLKVPGQSSDFWEPAKVMESLRNMRFPLITSEVEFWRPIYPYPTETRYSGHGDPRQAQSFGPADP